MSPCTCNPETFPFRCSRHACLKNRHFWYVCRNSPHYDPRYDAVWQREFGAVPNLPPASEPRPVRERPPVVHGSPDPAHAGLVEQLWNLATAVKDFVADGLQTVSGEEYAARLEICESCHQRSENVCQACGCYLTLKARGRVFECPLNKWPVPVDDAASVVPY